MFVTAAQLFIIHISDMYDG